VSLNQDVELHASILQPGVKLEHPLREGRRAWVQVVTGNVEVGGTRLETGDGLAVSEEKALTLRANEATHLLLFDLR
jgi:quercetin 2,3-dioxygenase